MKDNTKTFEIYATDRAAMPRYAEELKEAGYDIEPIEEPKDKFFKSYRHRIQISSVNQIIDLAERYGEIVVGRDNYIEIYDDYRE